MPELRSERNHAAVARFGLAVLFSGLAAFAAAQAITEFPIPTDDSDSWDLCAGPDGALWFNEPETLKMGRVDMQGNITEFPTPNGPYGCAAGPDGNIWFVGGPNLGRMTTSGQVTMLPGFDDQAAAYSIVLGSDGNLWIGLIEGRIARVTPAGVVTYFTLGFPIPLTGLGGPFALALGSDGNVWYSLPSQSIVGKITPDGSITNYSIPGGSGLGIGAGADGALWFRDASGAVERITTNGDVQTIGGQLSGDGVGIGAGPDGAVWFAEDGAEKLGRATPERVVTELDLPGLPSGFPHGAFDVLTGPDGNLWYVRRGENRIGRIELPSRRQPVLTGHHEDHPRSVPPRTLEGVHDRLSQEERHD